MIELRHSVTPVRAGTAAVTGLRQGCSEIGALEDEDLRGCVRHPIAGALCATVVAGTRQPECVTNQWQGVWSEAVRAGRYREAEAR